MNAPAMVSGDGSAPSVSAGSETSRTRTLRNDGGEGGLDLVGVEVELVRPDADEPDVEDEVRVGPRGQRRDRASAGSRWPLASSSSFSNVVAPTGPLLDRDDRASAPSVELDEERPCRPGPGRGRPASGAPGVGVRHRAGLAACAECQWPRAR